MANKILSKLTTKRVGVSSAVVGAAMLAAVPFITVHEGISLTAYQDVAKVWTICYGETQGVRPGMTATRAECKKKANARIYDFMTQVGAMSPADTHPIILAAYTSFAYNIGIAGFARSSTLAAAKAGDFKGSCEAMMNWTWITKNGKKYNCAYPQNKCTGLYKRRVDERDLCLSVINNP